MGLPLDRWLVYFMENATKIDDDWGYPYDETETPISGNEFHENSPEIHLGPSVSPVPSRRRGHLAAAARGHRGAVCCARR